MGDDFFIAPWIPILCSFSSCIVSGLTSFGDAIFFHIVWAIATASGGIPDGRDALAKAVTFVTIQSVSNVPLLFWLARKELWRAYPYGAVMGIAGCAMVPVGSSLLYFGNIIVVKWLAGLFFLSFSIWRLVSDGLSFVRSRVQSNEDEEDTSKPTVEQTNGSGGHTPNPCTTPVNPEALEAAESSEGTTDAVVVVIPSSASDNDTTSTETSTTTATTAATTTAAATNDSNPTPDISATTAISTTATTATSTASVESAENSPASAPANAFDRLISRLLPISDKLTKKKCLLVLFCAGLGAGFLGGLLGTGGPPQMIAFALMAIHKDIIRAISASYNSIEIPFRIIIFLNTDGNKFDFQNEWPLYIGIVLAAWTGYVTGTYLRRFADTAMILRFLLILVFASSGILLGALDNAWLAAVYVALTIVLVAVLLSIVFYPENWSRFVGKKTRKKDEVKKAMRTDEAATTIDSANIDTVEDSAW